MLLNKSMLQAVLSNVMRYVPQKTALPIIAHVRIFAENGKLKVLGTNLLASYEREMTAEGQIDICVPGKTITEILAKIKDETVEFSVDEKTLTLTLKYGKSRTKIKGMSSEKFPQIKNSFDKQFFISSSDLQEMIRFSFCTSPDHPIMSGIQFFCHDEKFSAMATDSFRASIVIKESNLPNFSIIIPAAPLQSLRLPEDEMIEVGLDSNVVKIRGGDFSFTTQLIYGQFPDVTRVIPKDFMNEIAVDCQKLRNAVETAIVFAKEVSNTIKLVIDDDIVTVIGAYSEIGDSENVVQLISSTFTNKFTVGVNGVFLLDVLQKSPSDVIRMKFNLPTNPIVFLFDEKPEFTHVLMPVYIK